MSIRGAKISIGIVLLMSKLPIEYIVITDNPSIINATTLRLALKATGDIPFAIKYAAIGGPPIAVTPFATPENIPTEKEINFVF